LWATQQLLPLVKAGEFADGLHSSREAAVLMHQKISADDRWVSPFPPELDILVWAVRADTVAASSKFAQQIFAAAARDDLHLALAQLPSRFFSPGTWTDQHQHESVICLRSVLMKPEHLEWLPVIWSKLSRATDGVLSQSSTQDSAATPR
jgi:hypothetical protein